MCCSYYHRFCRFDHRHFTHIFTKINGNRQQRQRNNSKCISNRFIIPSRQSSAIELLCEINGFASENVVRFIAENSSKRLRMWRLKTVRRAKLLTSDDRCAIGMACHAQSKINDRRKGTQREKNRVKNFIFDWMSINQFGSQRKTWAMWKKPTQLDSAPLSLSHSFSS